MSLTKVKEKINNSYIGATEGLRVAAHYKGELVFESEFGRVYKYYDLASLTKILFTVPVVMQLFEQKKISLNDKVRTYLNWYPHKDISLYQLLNHSAGHRSWTGYYEFLLQDPERKKKSFSQLMRPWLEKEMLITSGQSVYSDIDFLILGCLLEEVSGKSLLDNWLQLNKVLGLKDTGFSVENKPQLAVQDYAPTENCLWRKKIIQGEVHDDNAWALGGVASHAGLFGPLKDVLEFGLTLRRIYLGQNSFIKSETLRYFTRASTPKGDWGLGFMKPSRPQSSSGVYFSDESFGHTGFTGTSLWYDPKVDLLIVILANRTYPDRNNFRFRDELRPRIHDWIYEAVV